MSIKVNIVPINWHPGLSIYASEQFLSSFGGEYGWIGGMNDAGVVVCFLPYFIIKKSIFRMVRFPVQTILIDPNLSIEKERVFLNKIVEFLRNKRVDMIIPATVNSVFRTYPEGAIAAPFGSYILDLHIPEDELWANLHAKNRNVIRSAMKNDVVVKNGLEYLDISYNLINEAFALSSHGVVNKLRLKMRKDFDSFIQQCMCIKDNIKIFIAERDNIIQGCAVIHFSSYCAYYMHGGRIERPVTGSINLLQWEAIRHFKEIGVQYYDFVGGRISPDKGSKIEGIMNFKKRFGGKFEHGFMWKYPFRKFRYSLYTIASYARSGGDIVDQEMHKFKS